MKRAIKICGTLALAFSFGGCSTCRSPFDYTGPVPGAVQGGCTDCGAQARAGSVLSETADLSALRDQEPTLASPTARISRGGDGTTDVR